MIREYVEPDSPITDIQRYLRQISSVYPTVPQIAVDGIYGPQTTLAVREFQRVNEREPTGVVDYDTWELLRLTHNLIVLLNSDSVRGVNFPPDYRVLKGNQSEHVYYIAIMLNRIANMFDNIQTVEVSTSYDENIEKAIREFQYLAGLEATGITDKRTWQKLADVYAAYI